MSNVSKENLKKVESYFIEQVHSLGNKRIEATVVEIADGAGVALATAHKAIKELDQRGILDVIKPASRRFPITYIYSGDMEGFETAKNKDEEIAFLQARVGELEAIIGEFNKSVRNTLQNV